MAQHDELVARASRVPRACEAIVRMKPAFVREDGPLVRWERFVERCRAEVGLRKAEASLLRTAANYLHDAGELIALDRGRAAEVVVLTPTWLCATLVGELFAPADLHRKRELRKPLLTARVIAATAAATK